MQQFINIRRCSIGVVFLVLLLSACGPTGSSQPILGTPITTNTTASGGQDGGTACPAAMTVQNVDGTGIAYLSVQQKVSIGSTLLLALPSGTSQVVGLFQSQDDLNSYISHHNDIRLPLYQQQLYSGPSVLALKQANHDAYDLIILQGNSQGAKPGYDCRVIGNDQVDAAIQQLASHHAELQGVQPLMLSDYNFTQSTDEVFA